MAKTIRQKVYQYTAIFDPDEEDGGFTVTVPALPGCISEGDTFEEAVENIKDAIQGYLTSLIKDGEPIPTELEKLVVGTVTVKAPRVRA